MGNLVGCDPYPDRAMVRRLCTTQVTEIIVTYYANMTLQSNVLLYRNIPLFHKPPFNASHKKKLHELIFDNWAQLVNINNALKTRDF